MSWSPRKNEENIPLIAVEIQPAPYTSNYYDQNSRPVGIFLAITSGILLAAYGTLIKLFALDFLDVVFARCAFQVAFFGLCLCMCGPCASSLFSGYTFGFKSRFELCFMIAFQVSLDSMKF